jgi:hypothetical protein
MKRYGYGLWITVVAVSVAGCYTPQGRPDYTASGALAGAATGAIIGSTAARHSGTGALVGGALGAVAGGLLGHGMDQAQQTQLMAQSPQTFQRVEQGQPLTVTDVKALVRAGISDDLIISQIRNSRTLYHLSTADIIDLKNFGASEKVIDFMINTPSQIPTADVATVAGNPPPAPLPETVVVAPGPGYFWVTGSWVWFRGGWRWHPGYWHRPWHAHRYWH